MWVGLEGGWEGGTTRGIELDELKNAGETNSLFLYSARSYDDYCGDDGRWRQSDTKKSSSLLLPGTSYIFVFIVWGYCCLDLEMSDDEEKTKE
jgi:hypothetical protein